MPVTLRDVADYAQVSIRSVSNVVAGYQYVSPKMRARVEQAIADLNYRPNPVARTLRTGRTGMLMLVVPEINVPYFSQLSRDVIFAAAEEGYRVIIDQTGHDHAREKEILHGNDGGMLVDGMLFAPLATPDELADVSESSRPLVLLEEHDFDGHFDHVAVDNVQAAYEATRHLIGRGRRRIAAIGSQPGEGYATPLQRTAGFTRAMTEAGLPCHGDAPRPAAHYSRADGYRAASALVASGDLPDAIFCYSDLLAIGAMRAVFEAGLRVPDDVAIIGIDDIEEGRYSRPTLSTVSLDTAFIARSAVRRLAQRIDDPDGSVADVTAPHRLIARESTA